MYLVLLEDIFSLFFSLMKFLILMKIGKIQYTKNFVKECDLVVSFPFFKKTPSTISFFFPSGSECRDYDSI